MDPQMRKRPVTTDPYKLGALKEDALMDAMYCVREERDKFEDVEMWHNAAELDRSLRILKKMYYNEW